MKNERVLAPAPKHSEITQCLRQQFVARYHDGDRLPTISTLARQYRVSAPTLRTALLALAQEGLIDLQQGRGCFMRNRQAGRHVGVLVDLDFGLPTFSYGFRRWAQQLRRLLQEAGYPVRLYLGFAQPATPETETTCPDLLDAIARDELCGLAVLWGTVSMTVQRQLESRHIPIVGPSTRYPHRVMPDLVGMVRMGTRHLLAAGRRNIALMQWAPAPPDQRIHDEVTKEFCAVMTAHGVGVNEHWIVGDLHPTLPASGWAEFREIWTAGTQRPDAMLVTDDVLLQSMIPAICQLGIRVPEDLLIVAYANKGAVPYGPFPIWLMELDLDELAQATAQMLLQLLRCEPVREPQILIPTHWTDSEEQLEVSASQRAVGPTLAFADNLTSNNKKGT